MTGVGARREQVVLHLPSDHLSPALARRVVADVLDLWDCDDPDHVASLLTSELVTNVVEHAGSALDLELRLVEDVLRVAVSDGDSAPPQVLEPSADSERGRGIRLLSFLARSWGVEPTANGKVVWFELPVRRRSLVARAELPEPDNELLQP